MVFSKIENFLADNIEGFFNKKFASSLQLPELQKVLERTAMAHKEKRNKMIFLPSGYVIHMTEADYDHLNNNEVKTALRAKFLQFLATKNYFLDNGISIELCKSSEIKPGTCEVKVSAIAKNVNMDKQEEVEQGTIIAPACSFKELAEQMVIGEGTNNYASLHVYKGPDIESFLAIGEQQIHLGRREQNEFILTDPNVSRVHAYISFKNGRHFLTDANSLNGVKVNGKKVEQTFLKFGDEIELGNTGILYDSLED